MKINKFKRKIQNLEMDVTLKEIKLKKAFKPYGIHIKVWRCLGMIGVTCLY